MKKKRMKLKGFIDLHTHGVGTYDTRTANPEDVLKIAELHAKTGTSAILPTGYSDTIQKMRVSMEAVKKAIEIQKSVVRNQESRSKKLLTVNCQLSTVLGVHLEGPFLNPVRCGAQNKDSFIKPTISNLEKLINGYEDIIKIITIAPELPGALKVIEKCVSLGIKVNMGHSDATYKQALEGKKAGASGISHIFNAMRPFHHREPGLIGFGLLDEDIYIEVIADNIHINKTTLKLIFKIKRHDRIILVSDSVKGRKDILRPKGAKNRKGAVYSKRDVLVGSAVTLSDAVKNLKDIGIPEKSAIKVAVDNPKRYLSKK